jgi:hypothetical protein
MYHTLVQICSEAAGSLQNINVSPSRLKELNIRVHTYGKVAEEVFGKTFNKFTADVYGYLYERERKQCT